MDCSNNANLARLFAQRVNGTSDAWKTMRNLVELLHRATSRKRGQVPLERCLSERNVSQLKYDSELDCDGFVQPLGLRYDDGFRIVLNPSRPASRVRFTLAHELCHTFFYEYVPELKFVVHDTDETEESLCNFGAAELLMPTKSLTRDAKALPVSLRSLTDLASSYDVSIKSMLIRLRALRLWNADLAFWTRRQDGSFVSEEVGDFRRVNWEWRENELINTWETGAATTGKTFVRYVDPKGRESVLPICYEMQRRHRRVIVLWGAWGNPLGKQSLPLFRNAPANPKHSKDLQSAGPNIATGNVH